MYPFLKPKNKKTPAKAGARGWLLAAGLGLLAGAAMPAFADHALVVGINHYPGLPNDEQLGGPANDALAMAQKLQTLGFTVSTLTDAAATKAGILAALDHMKTANSDSERFVFYFAGHGAKSLDGSGVILASDASPSDKTNYLTKDDLYAAIAAVPAKGRTVLLDSCFSGAMQRGLHHAKGLHPHRKSRYYDFFGLAKLENQPGTHSKRIELVNDNDDPQPVDPKPIDPVNPANNPPPPVPTATDAVCYFVAANPYQPAYEDDIDGKRDGLFTHYLLSRLSASPEPWQPVQTDVTGNVMGMTDGTQTPCLTASYSPIGVFDGPGGVTPPPPPAPKAKSVWDAFSEDQKDSSQVLLEMTPNSSTVALKQKFRFKATVGSEGYLIVMELDTDGNLNLLSPASRNSQDAHVQGNTVVTIPKAGKAFTVDKEGTERVKAVLFTSEDAAKQLLAAFPDNGTITSWRKAKDRKIQLTDADPFFTSAVGFVVSGTK